MALLGYRRNVYSQNGEDGVLAELLGRLGMDNGSKYWCVEFGAWDGKHLSNTFNLVESKGWHAVYIEGDPKKFRELEATVLKYDRVIPLLGIVGGRNGQGSALDDFLGATPIPLEYDLLSIDIDSFDLDVWYNHSQYRPTIVVIEINSGIPPGVLQWHGPDTQGNSFSSTVNVASSKGYTLVCHTGNLIFVSNDLVESAGIDEIDRTYPERLFQWSWIRRGEPGFLKVQVARVASRMPASLKRATKKPPIEM